MQSLNILGWASFRNVKRSLSRKTVRQRMWRVLNIVVATVTIANVSAIGLAIAPRAALANFGSGAIWTTNESCANPAAQNDNEYAIGETVHIRGDGFDPNFTLYFQVVGQPGHASADPATIVASGSTTTDGTGYFCVAGYTVANDDDGTYSVDVDETVNIHPPLKNDNYRVNGTLFGSITVSKSIDTDGDGTFEGGDSEGNAAGFRWGVDLDPADREFGTTLVDVTADDYEISENSQNGYHVAGWYYTNGDGSCESPDGNSLPASISVSSNKDTAVTICNARNVYRIQVNKWLIPIEGEDVWNPDGWTWSLDDESGIEGGDYRNVIGGVNHTITETPDMFSAPGFTTTWQCHPFESESLLGFGEGRSFNTDELDFGADHGDWVYCYFTNREVPTYGIHGQKWNDLNGSGVWDNGEPALNGWTVYLDNNDNGQLDGGEQSMDTQAHDDGIPANDDNGWYWFEGLEAGTYKICEVQQAGWNQTYPQNDNSNCHTMIVGSSEIEREDPSTCSSQETLNAVLAPSCNFGNQVIPGEPDLEIEKSNNITTFVNPNATVEYTVSVTNTGDAVANDVVLTDTLPAGFSYVAGSASETPDSVVGQVLTWNVGNMNPAEVFTVTYDVAISHGQAAGTYINTAIAGGENVNEVEANSNVEVRLPIVLGEETDPALELTKSVNPAVTNPGKTIEYTLTVKSVGTEDAQNVIVTDTLPAGFTYLDGTSSKSWTFATIAMGEQETITAQVEVGANVKAGNYENTAVALADQVNPVTAKASVEVRVPQVLGLAETGVGLRDYLMFSLGLLLVALGYVGFNRSLRRNQTA